MRKPKQVYMGIVLLVVTIFMSFATAYVANTVGEDKWYTFPLMIRCLLSTLAAGVFGLGSILTGID